MSFGQDRRKVGAVKALAFLSLILISLPVLAILFKIELAATPEWLHFKEFLLKDTVYNTVYLIVFSLFFSAVLGVLAAVSVALFDFPLKRFFKWFFYMPLAIPPYIAESQGCCADLFDYTVSLCIRTCTRIFRTSLRRDDRSFPRSWPFTRKDFSESDPPVSADADGRRTHPHHDGNFG